MGVWVERARRKRSSDLSANLRGSWSDVRMTAAYTYRSA
jgi:hypothetical protein